MCEQLSYLSDDEIICGLSQHIRREQESTEQVIKHLIEVERRGLHLGLGYSSLFDYLTRGFRYSESSAMRRISAARAAIKVPEVLECLEKGELNLSTVGLLAGVLSKTVGKKLEGKEVLEKFRGKSLPEAKQVAAMMIPVPPTAMRDRIAPVAIAAVQDERQSLLGFDRKEEADENSNYLRANAQLKSRFQISFGADEEFMKLLEHAKEISFHGKKEDLTLENVIGKALRAYVERRCPKEREARRQARRERAKEIRAKSLEPKALAQVKKESSELIQAETIQNTTEARPETLRRIPIALRDQILARDGHRCTYVGSAGVLCSSSRNSHIDHFVPFARGGETKAENLRALCAVHNLTAAREVFGKDFIASRIAALGLGRCVRIRVDRRQ